jgi:Uma2 family endonuclease
MVMVEEAYLPLTLSAPGMTDAEFERFCEEYSNYRLEYTAEGELIIMPPTDPETSAQNATITCQLFGWASKARRDGIVTDSSGGFTLPDGARLSPDAAWTSRERLRRRPTCPEFVIELLSPFDRPRKIHAKMLEWIENGSQLGWMINPRNRSVTIYRPAQEPEIRTGILRIEGEGPVAGFALDLAPIWNTPFSDPGD